MVRRVFPGGLVLVVLASLCAPGLSAEPAAVQAPLPKKKEKIVAAVLKSAERLIKGARANLAASYAAYDKLRSQKSEVAAVKQTLSRELTLADSAHQRSEEQLHQSLHELNGLETAQLIIPHIVSLHEKLLQFVQRYRQQAGVAVPDPDPDFAAIGGEFLAQRRAMSIVIKSEAIAMQRVRKALQASSDWVHQLQRECDALARNLDDRAAPFGAVHYLSLAVQQCDTEQEILRRVTPFYSGKDLNNKNFLPEIPGYPPAARLPAFNTELSEISGVAYGAQALNEWKTYDAWMRTFMYRYDRSPAGYPGWIEHWTDSYQTKENSVAALKKDLQREMERGNFDLARALDQNRFELQCEVSRLRSERDSVQERRDQARLIWDAAGVQATWPRTNPLDGAWRRTVKAHTQNLQAIAFTYQHPLNAGIKLLQKAAAELPPLLSIADEQDLKAAFAQAARKLDSINYSGFKRLLGQMDAAIEGLQTMSANMGSGSFGMSEAIQVYAETSQLKFEDMLREKELELPAALAAKRTEVADRRVNFEASFQFVKDLEETLLKYESLNKDWTALMTDLDGLLANNRLNPIYSKLVDLMMAPYLNHPEYLSVKKVLDQRLQDLLKSFPARTLTAPSGAGASAKPAPRKRLAPAVRQEQKRLLKKIAYHINEVSRTYLNRRTLAEVLGAAAGLKTQITALDDFVKK